MTSRWLVSLDSLDRRGTAAEAVAPSFERSIRPRRIDAAGGRPALTGLPLRPPWIIIRLVYDAKMSLWRMFCP